MFHTQCPSSIEDNPLSVILSIDSVRAAHDEQKLGSSLKLGYEVCEGSQDVDRQL